MYWWSIPWLLSRTPVSYCNLHPVCLSLHQLVDVWVVSSLECVLVHSGCCNKNTIDQVAINNRNIFLTTLEAGKIKAPADLVWWGHLWDTWLIDGHLFNISSCGRGDRELSGVSFIRTLIPFVRAPSSWPNHLSKPSPPKTIILGVRLQHMDFVGGGRDTNTDSMAEWLWVKFL